MGAVRSYHLTKAGVAELKHELEQLKRQRLTVAERLKVAKEQGDLTENSDWANAQDEYKYVESRIDEIQHILRNVIIIKKSRSDVVLLGSQVELSTNGKKARYSIVGSLESNPEAGKISDDSPVGKALLGKKLGEAVAIKTRAGNIKYKITKIS
ncbi:transcription elongation factor GreA [Candidatus Microgenomates bacterium]|nr:transcription elongation factor GreA [Candidatus Microgenomates bacterium]